MYIQRFFKIAMLLTVLLGVKTLLSEEKGIWRQVPDIMARWISAAVLQPHKVLNRIYIKMTSKNFHQIMPGFYRSAQLSHSELSTLIDEGTIAAILSLRRKEERGGYESIEMERTLAQEKGIPFIHIPLDAKKKIEPAALESILATLRQASFRPLLIHCKAGADRTGLVAALLALETGKSLDQALEHQEYGHISVVFPHMQECIRAWNQCKEQERAGLGSGTTLERYRAWYNVQYA